MPATINTTTTTVIDVEDRVAVRPVRIKLNGVGSRGGGNGRKGGKGNNGGGNNNNNDGGGHDDQPTRFSPARYWVCLITALAAILMTFAALTIAYVARTGGSQNWRPNQFAAAALVEHRAYLDKQRRV